MGTQESVEIFMKIDEAWTNRDFKTFKSFVADDAKIYTTSRNAQGMSSHNIMFYGLLLRYAEEKSKSPDPIS